MTSADRPAPGASGSDGAGGGGDRNMGPQPAAMGRARSGSVP